MRAPCFAPPGPYGTRAGIWRHEQPDDLTGTVVFLASGESDFMTGQSMVVDGGAAMH
jgi:3-oxoacyl-[acyl-carrier protein] reductase